MDSIHPIPSKNQKSSSVDLHKDFQNVKDSIGEAATHVKAKTDDLMSEAREKAKEKTTELQKNITTYVRNNPLATIGYSMLAGFLAALILRK